MLAKHTQSPGFSPLRWANSVEWPEPDPSTGTQGESEVGGYPWLPREFETSLGYMTLYLKIKKKNKSVQFML